MKKEKNERKLHGQGRGRDVKVVKGKVEPHQEWARERRQER